MCIHVEGLNAGNPDPKHDPQMLLQEALRAANIESNCGGGSGDGNYKPFILVGRRPVVVGDRGPILGKLGRWIMRLGQ